MFDHVREKRDPREGLNRTALLTAIALMLLVIGTLSYASVWLLARLGLDIRPTIVEVSYDPMGDGRTLEDLQAEEAAREAQAQVPSAPIAPASGEELSQDR